MISYCNGSNNLNSAYRYDFIRYWNDSCLDARTKHIKYVFTKYNTFNDNPNETRIIPNDF